MSSERRHDGYRRALQQAGIPIRRELQREGPHGRLVAHRLTRDLLTLPEPPTAIFAASDTQALGVLEAASFEGVSVPGNSPSSASTIWKSPLRGTHDRPPAARGQRPARGRTLVAAMHAEDAEPYEERLELELKVRRTTAGPR